MHADLDNMLSRNMQVHTCRWFRHSSPICITIYLVSVIVCIVLNILFTHCHNYHSDFTSLFKLCFHYHFNSIRLSLRLFHFHFLLFLNHFHFYWLWPYVEPCIKCLNWFVISMLNHVSNIWTDLLSPLPLSFHFRIKKCNRAVQSTKLIHYITPWQLIADNDFVAITV